MYSNGIIRARAGLSNDDGDGTLGLGAKGSTTQLNILDRGNVGIGT